MTTNAVNWKIQENRLALDKWIAENIDLKKYNLSEKELAEKVRHNQAEEYFTEKKVPSEIAKNYLTGIGTLLKALGGSAMIPAAIGEMSVNDESYHNKLTVLYDQATNIPFPEYAGNPHTWDLAGFEKKSVEELWNWDRDKKVPNSGIIHVRYIPTISVNDQQVESSELQNNVRRLWTPTRQANSGAVNQYDQSDEMQFTLGSSSVFEILRLFARPLNYINAKRKPMNVFSSWDMNMLSIMCGNTTNANRIIKEKTLYISAINSAIRATNSQALPIGFDLTKRRSLLNGRIFTHDGNRDEYYLFSPTCYYVYDEANAVLKAKELNLATAFASPDNMKAILDEMLIPLVNGTATSTMAGDMAKAFPKQVTPLRELSYALKGDVYSTDEHILEALRNANILSNIPGYGTQIDIKQGINAALDTYIYQGEIIGGGKAVIYSPNRTITEVIPYLSGDEADLTYINLLDVKKDKPEPYDIMAGTRFKNSFYVTIRKDDVPNVYSRTYVYQWSTEIINKVRVYYYDTESKFRTNTMVSSDISGCNYQEFLPIGDEYLDETTFYSRYHYLPMKFRIPLLYGNNTILLNDLTHGRYNSQFLTDEQLRNLNDASFGSLITIQPSKTEDVA